jgi:hypothetical protein
MQAVVTTIKDTVEYLALERKLHAADPQPLGAIGYALRRVRDTAAPAIQVAKIYDGHETARKAMLREHCALSLLQHRNIIGVFATIMTSARSVAVYFWSTWTNRCYPIHVPSSTSCSST